MFIPFMLKYRKKVASKKDYKTKLDRYIETYDLKNYVKFYTTVNKLKKIFKGKSKVLQG